MPLMTPVAAVFRVPILCDRAALYLAHDSYMYSLCVPALPCPACPPLRPSGEFLAMFQDQLLDLKKVQAWLASRGDDVWEWGGAASSLLQVRRLWVWWGVVGVIWRQQQQQVYSMAVGCTTK